MLKVSILRLLQSTVQAAHPVLHSLLLLLGGPSLVLFLGLLLLNIIVTSIILILAVRLFVQIILLIPFIIIFIVSVVPSRSETAGGTGRRVKQKVMRLVALLPT